MINVETFIMKWMFLFGHIGITLGAAALVNGLAGFAAPHAKNLAAASNSSIEKFNHKSIGAWFASLEKFLDIRLLLVGSLLPDIIDKPLAYIFNFGSGRSVSHTLLFALVFVVPALYLYIARRQTWLLALAFGVASHLVLDSMWETPRTLFWPVYGWIFPPRASANPLGMWIAELVTNRVEEAFEFVGLLIFALFLWTLIRRHKLVRSLIDGDPGKSI
jgi:inner membrane protein